MCQKLHEDVCKMYAHICIHIHACTRDLVVEGVVPNLLDVVLNRKIWRYISLCPCTCVRVRFACVRVVDPVRDDAVLDRVLERHAPAFALGLIPHI